MDSLNILILCTGNTCRSQMAEVFLQSLDSRLKVFSAGTKHGNQVHQLTVKVMAEKGFDLSKNKPKSVDNFIDMSFDYVITVCEGAKEACPVFTGKVKHHLHIGFEDPAAFQGDVAEKLNIFRQVRDKIFDKFKWFYQKIIENYD